MLIGTWATDRPYLIRKLDAVVPGEITFEWLEGGKFLIERSCNEHELFLYVISVIGTPEDGEGLVPGVLRLARRAPDLRARR